MGIIQSSKPQEKKLDEKDALDEKDELDKKNELENNVLYMYCLWKIKKNKINKEKINKQFLDENILAKIDKFILDKFTELNITLEPSDISTLNNNIKLNSELNMKKSLYKLITKEYNNLENEYNNLLYYLNDMKYDNYELYNKIELDKIYDKFN